MGFALIAGLFVIDKVASDQVFAPPYTYDYDPDLRKYVEYPTFYPERGSEWVQAYYRCDEWIWGLGLLLSASLIYLGFREKGRGKSEVQ